MCTGKDCAAIAKYSRCYQLLRAPCIKTVFYIVQIVYEQHSQYRKLNTTVTLTQQGNMFHRRPHTQIHRQGKISQRNCHLSICLERKSRYRHRTLRRYRRSALVDFQRDRCEKSYSLDLRYGLVCVNEGVPLVRGLVIRYRYDWDATPSTATGILVTTRLGGPRLYISGLHRC